MGEKLDSSVARAVSSNQQLREMLGPFHDRLHCPIGIELLARNQRGTSLRRREALSTLAAGTWRFLWQLSCSATQSFARFELRYASHEQRWKICRAGWRQPSDGPVSRFVRGLTPPGSPKTSRVFQTAAEYNSASDRFGTSAHGPASLLTIAI